MWHCPRIFEGSSIYAFSQQFKEDELDLRMDFVINKPFLRSVLDSEKFGNHILLIQR